MPNGCGVTGGISKLWRLVTGQYPPFEECCLEHDLAYEQAPNASDRLWADSHFLRCMTVNGWPKLGAIFFIGIRAFGWLAVLRHKPA